MAIDKAVDSAVLDGYFTDIADAIRAKAETSDTYTPEEMPQAIEDISTGGDSLNDVLLAGTQTEYSNDAISIVRAYLFYYCTSLRKAAFNAANTIQNEAFRGCSALTEIDAPNVGVIKSNAFKDCSSLASVAFPLCTSLEQGAFNNCAGFTKVEFPLVAAINPTVLAGCTHLQEAKFPFAALVGNSAFSGCTELTEIELPTVNSVDSYGFNGCSGLQIIDMGYTAQARAGNFYMYAFQNCSSLVALVLRKTGTIFNCNSTSVFSGTPIASGTGYIYVPRDLVATYQAATNWSTFANQIRAVEDYTADGTLTGDFILPE